jgi:hypothetical protein
MHKAGSYLKNNQHRANGVTQVVEHLASKREALSLSPNTAKHTHTHTHTHTNTHTHTQGSGGIAQVVVPT